VRDWDTELFHNEFADNRTSCYATSLSPFEECYGFNSLIPLDVIPLSHESNMGFEVKERTKEMKKLHKQMRAQIKKVNG